MCFVWVSLLRCNETFRIGLTLKQGGFTKFAVHYVQSPYFCATACGKHVTFFNKKKQDIEPKRNLSSLTFCAPVVSFHPGTLWSVKLPGNVLCTYGPSRLSVFGSAIMSQGDTQFCCSDISALQM